MTQQAPEPALHADASDHLPAPSEFLRLSHRPPFLVWPVARREFYYSITIALLLPLTWGALIFGWRAILVMLATLGGASLAHVALRRFRERGRRLLTAHTITSALMLAALAGPLWPPYIMASAGAMMVILVWLFRGPGHERVHAWALVLLAVMLAYEPWRPEVQSTLTGTHPDAILARNRLVMGDLTASAPRQVQYWPESGEIGGHDAVRVQHPPVVVRSVLDRVQAAVQAGEARVQDLRQTGQQQIEALLEAARESPTAPDLQGRLAAMEKDTNAAVVAAQRYTQRQVARITDSAFARDLPGLEAMFLGITPGRIGTVSAVGIVLGGLYLAYRNILRPRSWALFLGAVLLGLVLATLQWSVPRYVGGTEVLSVSQLSVLLLHELFSRDYLFASVFILALPGTEPITPAGRRLFLLIAGIIAGYLYRYDLPVPPTMMVLALAQLVAPLFDIVFARRSWLEK